MRNKLILAAVAALATAPAAAPAASFATFDLYNISYLDGNNEEVGFGRGVCGYSNIEHELLYGQETEVELRQYVGICNDGAALYY